MNCSTASRSPRILWNRDAEVRPGGGAESGGFDDISSLTRAVASGDPRAVAVLYEAKFAMVMGVAKRAGFDEASALDVVQETFIKAVRGMVVVGTEVKLDGWLRRIALCVVLDELRGQRRRAARARGRGGAGVGEREERIGDLRKELAEMDGSTLELLQLRYQAGLTLDAIARRLGTTAGAVDGRLRRATGVLRKRMKAEEER